ncbi:DUF7405 family protein [Halopenitus persicus]|uniref:DUF7405 family protein n=1 Tax=Halopenitus persicus TaxID=1048396 RepID=UPI000BBB29C8|nr:hypothetical protein [Halopenitus persicus]
MTSRRGLLGRLTAVALAAIPGCSTPLSQQRENAVSLPPNPYEVPDRQHAWDVVLPTDAHGNRRVPRHHRVLLLNLDVDPSTDAADTVETAMRELEATYEWSADGLLHMLAWGTRYFERIGELAASPIRHPEVLSRTDDPDLLSYDAALVLASDVRSHLHSTETAMFSESDPLEGREVEARLGEVFSVAVRRTGFHGEGLPAEHAGVESVPDDVPRDAPMFTGFSSMRRGTQPSEDRVTIDGDRFEDGRFEGGTTMHLSHLTESLDGWWNMDESERVDRMFSPQFSPADVESFTDDVPFHDRAFDNAEEFGVVGHHEKVARARDDGEPVILRRDFNTTDGNRAGVHFLSLQASLDDFVATRKAMNGWFLRNEHDLVTDRKNNGLLNVIEVESRANFYVPPRHRRAFPGFSPSTG